MVAAAYGEGMIAALTVSSKIVATAFMIMVGWGQGFQPICAMNYGAKNYDRVKKQENSPFLSVLFSCSVLPFCWLSLRFRLPPY